MAAALIPLIASLAPEVINLIVGLVHKQAPVAEQNLGSGTGPAKFTDVFSYVIDQLQKAAAAGTIDKALPSDESIKLIIQSVVSSLKLQGLLTTEPAPVAPVPAGSQQITLAHGQSITIVGPA